MVALDGELPTATTQPSADAIPLRLRGSGGSPRQVFAMVLIGTLVLAALASRDLSSWLDGMGDGPVLVPLQRAADEWNSAMTWLGLTRPAEGLRAAVRDFLDWQWPEHGV